MFDKEQVKFHCDQIDLHNQAIRDMLSDVTEPEPPMVNVDTADELSKAMAAGGKISIAVGSNLTDDFKFSKSDTLIYGGGNVVLNGDGRAALTVPLNVHRTGMEDIQLKVTRYEVCYLMGRNDTTQIDPAVVPSNIVVERLLVSDHRGKRAIEINAKGVVIKDSSIYGVYDPEGLDSQAICILNSPGDIYISNCHLEGASENFMVGGDEMKLPNTRPTKITVENCMFTKPIAWKTAGTPKVKTLFELKDGNDVTVRNCKLKNCWVSAQDGYCFMLTPRRQGTIRNCLIENCDVENVGAVFNVTGFDDPYPNLPRTTLRIKGGKFRTNKAEMGGTGRFMMITNGPESVIIDGIDCQHEGNAFLGVEDKDPVGRLHILNSIWNYGTYGIRIGGYSDGDNQLGIVKDLKIEGNIILGANARFKTRYPNNIFQ